MPEGGNEYSQAVEALPGYFKPKTNPSYERHMFRQMKQKPEGSIETFIARLRIDGKNCDFGANLERELCDQVISCCHSNMLRRKLLAEQNLTVQKILEMGRTLELVESRAKCIEKGAGAVENVPVDAVHKKFNKSSRQFEKVQRNHTTKDVNGARLSDIYLSKNLPFRSVIFFL